MIPTHLECFHTHKKNTVKYIPQIPLVPISSRANVLSSKDTPYLTIGSGCLGTSSLSTLEMLVLQRMIEAN